MRASKLVGIEVITVRAGPQCGRMRSLVSSSRRSPGRGAPAAGERGGQCGRDQPAARWCHHPKIVHHDHVERKCGVLGERAPHRVRHRAQAVPRRDHHTGHDRERPRFRHQWCGGCARAPVRARCEVAIRSISVLVIALPRIHVVEVLLPHGRGSWTGRRPSGSRRCYGPHLGQAEAELVETAEAGGVAPLQPRACPSSAAREMARKGPSQSRRGGCPADGESISGCREQVASECRSTKSPYARAAPACAAAASRRQRDRIGNARGRRHQRNWSAPERRRGRPIYTLSRVQSAGTRTGGRTAAGGSTAAAHGGRAVGVARPPPRTLADGVKAGTREGSKRLPLGAAGR